MNKAIFTYFCFIHKAKWKNSFLNLRSLSDRNQLISKDSFSKKLIGLIGILGARGTRKTTLLLQQAT